MEEEKEKILNLLNEYSVREHSSSNIYIIMDDDFEDLANEIVNELTPKSE